MLEEDGYTWTSFKEMGDPTQAWRSALEELERDFEELIKAKETHSEVHRLAVQRWWMQASGILWYFARAQAQGTEVEPAPAVLLGRLANIAEELANGNLPWLVADSADNARKYWRAERQDIAYAVFYVEACKAGKIRDRSVNKTVREAYNVTSRTVQRWVADRENICRGVFIGGLSPEELTGEMRTRGERYSLIGRGAPSD